MACTRELLPWPIKFSNKRTIGLHLKAYVEIFVKKCDVCKQFGRTINAPAVSQTSILTPWPFSQWSIEIIGPFPQNTRYRKYVIMVVKYFLKWPKAKAVKNITA